MGRWEPGARGRLAQAAMELYVERGFDQTTVAEIARRAGLTERTFFRHYADKREVLFWGAGELQEVIVRGVADAPAPVSPIEAVAAGLAAAGVEFEGRREGARNRHAIIVAHSELLERELIKMAALASAVAGALCGRGVTQPTASLAAEAGVAVFRVAFDRWVADSDQPDLAQLMRELLDELRDVTAGRRTAPAATP